MRSSPLIRLRSVLEPTLRHPRRPPTDKAAAVAAILREGSLGPEVLFIRRAERDGDPWSGHMAFPGGRFEAGDSDLLRTAVRETDEEVGVDLERSAELLGALEDQDATGRGGLLGWPIRPYVFQLVSAPTFSLSQEVTELVWTPLTRLTSGENRTTVSIQYKGVDYDLPGWDLEGRVVWGLTYRMMSTLLGHLDR